jgi:Ferredoxin subunits of nitrite reductase and ring-hydroxylating dioxygenases
LATLIIVKIRLFDLDQLPEGSALSFTLGSKQAFAIHREGAIYAYLNACPHLGIPLEWMPNEFLDDENELIQCSTHGALFLIDTGECVSGPCRGDRLTPIAIQQDATSVYLDE